MAQSAQKRRAFTGPALYSHGFKSFFLFAGLWALLSISLWISFLALGLEIPSRMAGVDWHMHEMVFGYTSAVIAGFLLTAVPNWTGRLPIIGWPAALLSGLWVLGRGAVFFSEFLPQFAVPVVDGSFLLVLALVIGREVIAGKNWRNLKVLVIIAALAGANILFHIESLYGAAYQGYGVRLGVGLVILLITIIGGRVVPSFTRNWLAKHNKNTLPLPRNMLDNAVETLTAIALLVWTFVPDAAGLWGGYLLIGALHLFRLWRWVGWHALAEPMVSVLHAGYLFVGVGFFMLAYANLSAGAFQSNQIPHAWMAGAIGIMTMAMMTRASLGHSGRPIKASAAITLVYIFIISTTLFRMVAEFYPSDILWLHLSATTWIAGFALYLVVYFPIFTRKKSPNIPG